MAMRILHFGWFLQEGLTKIGCDVIPFTLDSTKTINQLVDETGICPDIVFLELFGKTQLPRELHKCKYKLAAYCIDSPLNEFWLIPLMRLFDFIYVDQLSSVQKFRKSGIQAKWIPLCVSEHDFRTPSSKEHFITFVGRFTKHRTKRTNLIEHIKNHYNVNIVQNVSKGTMLDIFSDSQVVLNENFFPGLNLRFFQTLASGALLLTERNSYGIHRYFKEGEHYIGYSPHDIVTTLNYLEKSGDICYRISQSGREECRKHHTSAHRARVILDDMITNPCQLAVSTPDRKIYEAQSKYHHARRFGGYFDESVQLLHDTAEASDSIRSEAMLTLGSIYIRSANNEPGVACLEKSASITTFQGLNATLKLMLLFSESPLFFKYLSRAISILREMNLDTRNYSKYIRRLINKNEIYYNCCLLSCDILYEAKRVYDIGFYKLKDDPFPDYALEYAILAFEHKKTSESLDAIIKCTDKANYAPEALYYIKSAILEGAASDEQITLSASLALEYYDFPYANSIVKTLKKTLSS
jgi:hypothetical protein